MAISSRQLGLLVSEIKTDLSGGMIRNIDQADANTLLFEIVQGGQCHRLLFSAHRNFARFHLVRKKTPQTKMPLGFCQLLRAHLRHKRIETIQQKNGDRIIEMCCRWSKESTKSIRFLAELTGTCANFYLLDTEGKILGLLRQAPTSRGLYRGAVYIPPPLHNTPRFQETQIVPILSSIFPLNHAVEVFFFALERQEREAREEKALLAHFDNAIKYFQKRRRRFQARLRASDKSLKFRAYGEYLKYHLHEILPGANSFVYPDPLMPGQAECIVTLNPALSATKNMAQFFKRYKKAVTEKSIHLALLAKTEADLKQLKAGKNTVMEGTPLVLEEFPLLSAKIKPPTKKPKKGLQVYLSSDNLRLMVGRNSLENDELTFRIARGNDLWFHVRGVSGSHLIVRMAKLKNLPPLTLLEAATLALYFSRYRKEGKGEVMYTYKKYLQRPKKGKPGAVICSQEKTIFIEIDPARLSKILESRISV